ncbi:MAG: zinc ribbon domain-containing protein [Bacilli bacterium]|nr:zinc ribbon domain-containing protein [Bacilli bacterium]
MEKKIKTLRVILMIGTIVLLIAGISFLFVSSVEPWIRTLTMGLIAAVLLFLSVYEEYLMKFKGDSIVSYIFSNVSITITYLCIAAYELFGNWFSLSGDGSTIYIAGFFLLVALLVLIASVKYKVYKLIELSVWLMIISIAFILKFFEVDDLYIYLGIIVITLINNIIRLTSYGKWATFAILIFGIFYLYHGNELFAMIVGLTMLANMIAIFYKTKKVIIPFILLYALVLPLMSHSCINSFIGLLIALGLEIILIATKAFNKDSNTNANYIVYKLAMILSYISIIIFSKIEGPFLFIVPTVVFIPSLLQSLLLKDEAERYILPFKVFYFVFAICYNLQFEFMKDYMALFITNMAILLTYFITSKKLYKIPSIVILVLINICGLSGSELISSIIFTLMFALDFYIVYVKEPNGKIPLTIAFILQGITSIALRESMCPESLIAVALMYGIFICITIKNKVLFAASLFGFVVSVSSYLSYIGLDSLYLGLVTHTLTFIALILYQFICIETEKGRAVFLGVTVGIHIGFLLLYPGNVLLKVFALVEAIFLLLFSIKNDEHKGLFDVGMVGVVASLLFILGTFESLPKSLYLIIVAMAIIIITPILIHRYIKKQKQEALLHPKEEVKEEVQPQTEEVQQVVKTRGRKKAVANNFCPMCGTKLIPDSAFCSECGHKIK